MQAGGRGHSDFASAVWKRDGWKEMARLQKLLASSAELKQLVESLGRARGRGHKQKAAQQVLRALSLRRLQLQLVLMYGQSVFLTAVLLGNTTISISSSC